MKASRIRDLTDKELQTQLEEAREEIRLQRFQFAVEKTLENPRKIRETRKKIARILTIQRERELSKGR